MSDNIFYPQEGALYQHRCGRVYRVLMTASRWGDMARVTVIEQIIPEHLSPCVIETNEFGEKFSYVPNWIDVDIQASQKAGHLVRE